MARELAVLGSGVGGLSAAIHARLKGWDVLVLEKSGQPGGKASGIDLHGFRLDPGPSIIILTRIYQQIFRDAGRNPDDYLRFRRLDPFSRVYFEGCDPVDLPADVGECLKVLDREAPQDGEAFRRLLETLRKIAPHIEKSVFRHPFHWPFQLANPHLVATALPFNVTQTFKELVDLRFRSPLLRAFYYGFPSYGGQTYDSKAPGALMIPYLMLEEGVWYPDGGVAAIPRALHRLAVELGVTFRFHCEVTGLESKGSKVTAVVLADGERVTAEKVISNVDKLTTRSWLGHRVDWKPSLSYFTLHWGLRKKFAGLKHHTLLVPKQYESGFVDLYRKREFPREPIVYLNETSNLDPETAPPGCTNLFAVITCPGDEPQLDWQRCTGVYRKRVLCILERFQLGFDSGDAIFERVQNPLYFAREHGNYGGSLYGPDESHRVMGLFPLRCIDEDYRNLLYAGGSVQPGAGLPMVALSGRFAANLL